MQVPGAAITCLPCCPSTGTGTSGCVETTVAPSRTLHAALIWDRPALYGGPVPADVDLEWDDLIHGWGWENNEEPIVFSSGDDCGEGAPSTDCIHLRELNVVPECCTLVPGELHGPCIRLGSEVISGRLIDNCRTLAVGGNDEGPTTVTSYSPLVIESTLHSMLGGCWCDATGDPCGWPITVVYTEVP